MHSFPFCVCLVVQIWPFSVSFISLARRFVKVSMDLVVRVLTVVLSWCPAMKRHAYIRSLERKAALLTSRGHITGVEVSKSPTGSSVL